MKIKRYFNYLGKVITILSLIFVIKMILSLSIDLKIIISPKMLVVIILCALFLSINVFLNSLAWKKLIEMISSTKMNTLEVFHIYAKANISKYLPGNFMHYTARNLIGYKYNIEHADMAFSTIIEIILKVISAFLLATIFIRKDLYYVINQLEEKIYFNTNILIAIIFLMIISLIIFLYLKSKKIMDEHINLKNVLFSFIVYILILLFNIFAFIVVSKVIVNSEIIDTKAIYISGAYIIAWLLGYLTPGSPGGIGVREAVMLLMLSDILSVEKIVIVSICVRLITILADVYSYVFNEVLERRKAEY